MAKTTQPAVNLLSLMSDFDTDAECRAYLEELRWPEGVTCPRCESKSVSRIKARKVFDCDKCRYQFSVTAGTIFHDSHLPLTKWFLAIFLLTESKKGMSALQLKRLLKVSYKTAWYLSHRIRAAMTEQNPMPLTGTVEIDETYIGSGRGRGQRGVSERHTMILAAIQRGGDIRMRKGVQRGRSRKELHGFAQETVGENCDFIYTDEAPGYKGVQNNGYTQHLTVNHSQDEYVRGDVHTNTVESAFSLFKRSVVGSFHQVSAKHLDRYLDEFEFRYNNRKNPYMFRDTLLRVMSASALPYDKLTA